MAAFRNVDGAVLVVNPRDDYRDGVVEVREAASPRSFVAAWHT
jgi:hypothetical protein